MLGLLVTGTDTNVGKTWIVSRMVRSLLLQGHRVGAYKPVCSGGINSPLEGTVVWEDLERIYRSLDGRYPRERVCPQCFEAPLAPPVAAAREGREVDEALVFEGLDWWRQQVDLLVVEGVGGWKCPLTRASTIADFAQRIGFRVLIVAANRLGVLNHTLLTLESIQQSGLPVAGIVLNNITPESDLSGSGNRGELCRRVTCPVWGPVPYQTGSELQPWPGFETMSELDLFGPVSTESAE